MSNNPPSPVVARIQQSTLVFIVLILIVGALLLLTTGIDPQATVRASLSATPVPPTLTATTAPTVNAFASTGYKTYQSTDNVLKIDYPDQWTPITDPNNPLTYLFSPGGNQNTTGTVVVVQVGTNADLIQGLTGATEKSTPKDVLNIAFGQPQAGQPPVTVSDVKAGSYTGAGIHQVNPLSQGQPTNQERELWILTLDPAHVAVIQATTRPGQWNNQLRPIFQHMMDTLSVNIDAANKAAATAAVTSAATAGVTTGATGATGAASTSAATAAATTAVTVAATTGSANVPVTVTSAIRVTSTAAATAAATATK